MSIGAEQERVIYDLLNSFCKLESKKARTKLECDEFLLNEHNYSVWKCTSPPSQFLEAVYKRSTASCIRYIKEILANRFNTPEEIESVLLGTHPTQTMVRWCDAVIKDAVLSCFNASATPIPYKSSAASSSIHSYPNPYGPSPFQPAKSSIGITSTFSLNEHSSASSAPYRPGSVSTPPGEASLGHLPSTKPSLVLTPSAVHSGPSSNGMPASVSPVALRPSLVPAYNLAFANMGSASNVPAPYRANYSNGILPSSLSSSPTVPPAYPSDGFEDEVPTRPLKAAEFPVNLREYHHPPLRPSGPGLISSAPDLPSRFFAAPSSDASISVPYGVHPTPVGAGPRISSQLTSLYIPPNHNPALRPSVSISPAFVPSIRDPSIIATPATGAMAALNSASPSLNISKASASPIVLKPSVLYSTGVLPPHPSMMPSSSGLSLKPAVSLVTPLSVAPGSVPVSPLVARSSSAFFTCPNFLKNHYCPISCSGTHPPEETVCGDLLRSFGCLNPSSCKYQHPNEVSLDQLQEVIYRGLLLSPNEWSAQLARQPSIFRIRQLDVAPCSEDPRCLLLSCPKQHRKFMIKMADESISTFASSSAFANLIIKQQDVTKDPAHIAAVSDILSRSVNSTIIYGISRLLLLTNTTLQARFTAYKTKLQESLGKFPATDLVFHGTTVDAAFSIAHNGFLKTARKRELHGSGHYFALHAHVAAGYTSDYTLVICKILQEASVYKDEPNNTHGPKGYIIVEEDHAILPVYILTFSTRLK